FAASLAVRYHARVTLLCVYEMGGQGGGAPSREGKWTVEAAQTHVADLALRLSDMGVGEVETNLVEGPAPNVILGVAESVKPDLIVVGARGSGTWLGQTLGSVSMAVVQRAECAVLVVK
nr:universal stress protein [Anaerolineales bacterium]